MTPDAVPGRWRTRTRPATRAPAVRRRLDPSGDAPAAPAGAGASRVKAQEKTARAAFLGREQKAARGDERKLSPTFDRAENPGFRQDERLLGGPIGFLLRARPDEEKAREAVPELRKARRVGRAVLGKAGLGGYPQERGRPPPASAAAVQASAKPSAPAASPGAAGRISASGLAAAACQADLNGDGSARPGQAEKGVTEGMRKG